LSYELRDQQKENLGVEGQCARGLEEGYSLHTAITEDMVAGEKGTWWFESLSHRIASFVRLSVVLLN